MEIYQPKAENQSLVKSLLEKAEQFTKGADYPGALKIYHELLDEMDRHDPAHFEVYKNMGNIYLKCGDIDAAEEKYNLANAINSQDESLIVNYGVLAIQKGEYSIAKARFSSVIDKNKSSDLAWVGLGLVHRAYSDHDLARACLQRGLDENPLNKIAITNFYQWCLQDGIDFSTNYVDYFLTHHPDDAEMNKLQSGMSQ